VPKKSGGLAQVIEQLPSKGKDLSSNLSTEKKKKEERKSGYQNYYSENDKTSHRLKKDICNT
jgi:hypothetical protein